MTSSSSERVIIRFFGCLTELTKGRAEFEIAPGVNQTIKDCIERLGVPHTEVSFITREGTFVGFSEIVEPGRRYFVYPESNLPVPDEYLVTPKYSGEPKFVLDIHLGKLAKLLRLFGFSVDYGIVDDEKIVEVALNESGIILTRDRKLLMRKDVTFGYVLRSDHSVQQLEEVFKRYDLASWVKPFSRCLICNGNLVPVTRDAVEGKVPIRVYELQEEFGVCSSCGKIYWSGSHYDHMQAFIERFLRSIGKTPFQV